MREREAPVLGTLKDFIRFGLVSGGFAMSVPAVCLRRIGWDLGVCKVDEDI
jgi:hypothetical protein